MNATLKKVLSTAITEATGSPFCGARLQPVTGGDINEAFLLSDAQQSYFIKLNTATKLDMFIAEAQSLTALRQSNSIRAPRPITHGQCENHAFLVLEAIDFGPPASDSWQQMGQQLAAMHRQTAEQFGWPDDNTIGSTPQHNAWTSNWADFFREQRLHPQFEFARKNGLQLAHTDALLQHVASRLKDHHPAPALLHGDLWSGNASFCDDGTPVLFDPASYYGDRETDLAFSEFFGGFAPEFYQGYNDAWPLPSGYQQRKTLYNLYHVLNHANLFGGNYITEAQQMIFQLLA
jgi:fructosamine-3-kinase